MNLRNSVETNGIKSQAMQTLGIISKVFKSDPEIINFLISPYLIPIFNLLMQSDDVEIREGCLSFFHNSPELIDHIPDFNAMMDLIFKIASNTGIA